MILYNYSIKTLGGTNMDIKTLGIDIAKNIFQVGVAGPFVPKLAVMNSILKPFTQSFAW